MSKSLNEEKAKQLYQQCQIAYKNASVSGDIWNEGDKEIYMPSFFDNSYNIPAELLFRELQTSSNIPTGTREEFYHRLAILVGRGAEYGLNRLRQNKNVNTISKKFEVFFQVYFRKKQHDSGLFNRQITMNGVVFKWCNNRTFSKIVSKFESKENMAADKTNIIFGNGFGGLYNIRRSSIFPEIDNEANLYAIKATIEGSNYVEATEKVAAAFSNFTGCVNTAQSFGSQSFNISEGTPEPRSAVECIGVFLVKNKSENKINILWSSSKKHTLPSQTIDITTNKSKKELFKGLLQAFNGSPSPVAKRLQYVTLEYALAIGTEDPNLRLLGFWRCLEITTRKSSENRKEKDVIKIFQSYHSDIPHWRQQGELILSARNAYVHQGMSSQLKTSNERYLNWSQQYAEVAIKILLYLYKNRSTWATENDIDIFFDFYSKPDQALELASELLTLRGKRPL